MKSALKILRYSVHINGTTKAECAHLCVGVLSSRICSDLGSVSFCSHIFIAMFSRIESFVAVFGILSLLSWSLYSVTVSQISNIEKAFGLSSSESGWLLTVWEMGYVICIIFASYFGSRAHQPRVMGIATIICGLSGFVFALPHFIAFSDSNNPDNVKENETLFTKISDINMCVNRMSNANNNSNSSSNSHAHITKSSSKAIAYVLLCIGMVLQGAGKAPCYPYSSQYVDDNVDQQKTGFYMGNYVYNNNHKISI